MSSFTADYSKKRVIQMSNDAFCYLLYGEEPLDENNLEEAEEIQAMFPYSFDIEDDWKAVENSDLIEATLIPYVEDRIDYDEYENLTESVQLQIKWLDASMIRAWWFNSKTGTRELRGDFNVYINKCGLKCFHTGNQDENFKTGKMSLYFLKNFKKKPV